VHVEHDHPHEAIIGTAKKSGCDAIVMVSHGRRGVSVDTDDKFDDASVDIAGSFDPIGRET